MKNIVLTYEQKWGEQPSWHTVGEYGIKHLNSEYFDVAKRAEKKGMRFHMSAFEWYKNGKFTKGWVVEGDKWVRAFNIKPDLVFDKTKLEAKYIKLKRLFSRKGIMLNPFFIEELCSDKLKTFRLFPKLTPRLFLVRNGKDLKDNMKKIRSDLAVLKPRSGSSAHGLYIENKKKLLKKKIQEDYVLQEFIDTTNGMPGLTKKVSDVRIIVAGGKVVDLSMRTQDKGLVSNISRGGKLTRLKVEQTPKEMMKATKEIDKKLKDYNPRMYAADFVLDEKGKAWLIEMNSKVGTPFYNDPIKKGLINILYKALKK